MRKILLFVFIGIVITSFAQERRILCFNLVESTVDTIDVVEVDTVILSDKTEFFIGTYSDEVIMLDEMPPEDNLFENTQFTRKRQASLDYDIRKFPIRTSVKLFKWDNDSLNSNCSGSFISKKHVLTACHCVAEFYQDSLKYDSIFVCPVYDNGEYSLEFEACWVEKIYFFENWNIGLTDFAILELEHSVGARTGWLGIGYDSNIDRLMDGMFYKFSYPAITMENLDSHPYNGDTLYYNYGVVDYGYANSIGIVGTNAIPGESGSSLIKIENLSNYTTYGTLSYSTGMKHCRITDWKYYALKSIIENDFEIDIEEEKYNDEIIIYPNPVLDIVNIRCADCNAIGELSIYDLHGRQLFKKEINSIEADMDLSSLNPGMYIMIIEVDNRRVVKKMIKN